MAEFRIDQASPGAGVAGRARHDLVSGEIVTLTATSPVGAGVTHTWEIIDKVNSGAILSMTGEVIGIPATITGDSVTIGPSGDIVRPCAFLVRLTTNDNGTVSTITRPMSVRTAVLGLRPPLFGEYAPQSQRLSTNDPDESTDNAYYSNLAGLGPAQNWRSWAEWGWELTTAAESAVALPTLVAVVDRQILTSDGEVIAGGFVINGSSFYGQGPRLRVLGRLTGTSAGVIRLYDMGTQLVPTAGALRAEATIDASVAPNISYADQQLTVVAAPGVNTDEIFNTTRMYEVRVESVGGSGSDTFKIHYGGLVLGD